MVDEYLLFQLVEYNKYRKSCFFNSSVLDINIDFERKLKARYNKVSRIKQHFIYMVMKKKNLYFITFTFDDNYINKSDRTKKDLIKNLLKEIDYNSFIILNVDYATINEPEHYHCIYGTNKDLDIKFLLNKYYPCFSYTEKIYLSNSSINKISKYINKLSNHAVKSSTKNSRIYYNFKGYGNMAIPEVRKEFLLDKECLSL